MQNYVVHYSAPNSNGDLKYMGTWDREIENATVRLLCYEERPVKNNSLDLKHKLSYLLSLLWKDTEYSFLNTKKPMQTFEPAYPSYNKTHKFLEKDLIDCFITDSSKDLPALQVEIAHTLHTLLISESSILSQFHQILNNNENAYRQEMQESKILYAHYDILRFFFMCHEEQISATRQARVIPSGYKDADEPIFIFFEAFNPETTFSIKEGNMRAIGDVLAEHCEKVKAFADSFRNYMDETQKSNEATWRITSKHLNLVTALKVTLLEIFNACGMSRIKTAEHNLFSPCAWEPNSFFYTNILKSKDSIQCFCETMLSSRADAEKAMRLQTNYNSRETYRFRMQMAMCWGQKAVVYEGTRPALIPNPVELKQQIPLYLVHCLWNLPFFRALFVNINIPIKKRLSVELVEVGIQYSEISAVLSMVIIPLAFAIKLKVLNPKPSEGEVHVTSVPLNAWGAYYYEDSTHLRFAVKKQSDRERTFKQRNQYCLLLRISNTLV